DLRLSRLTRWSDACNVLPVAITTLTSAASAAFSAFSVRGVISCWLLRSVPSRSMAMTLIGWGFTGEIILSFSSLTCRLLKGGFTPSISCCGRQYSSSALLAFRHCVAAQHVVQSGCPEYERQYPP